MSPHLPAEAAHAEALRAACTAFAEAALPIVGAADLDELMEPLAVFAFAVQEATLALARAEPPELAVVVPAPRRRWWQRTEAGR